MTCAVGAILLNPPTLAALGPHVHVRWLTLLLWSVTGALALTAALLVSSRRCARWFNVRWPQVVLLLASAALAVVLLEGALTVMPRLAAPKRFTVTNLEFAFSVSLNSDRFRDEEFLRSKPAGERRIFLIGDSQIYGSGVPQEGTIPRLLEQRLRRETGMPYRVFNLGAPDASPTDYLAIARRFTAYAPDLVLVALYVDNDLSEDESVIAWVKQRRVYRLLDLSFSRLVDGCPYPWVRQFPAEARYQEAACRGELNPFLLTRASISDNQAYYDRLARRFETAPHVRDAITRIRESYASTPFAVVVLPSKYQVDASYVPELRKIGFRLRDGEVLDDGIQQRIRAWGKTSGIDVLDLLPVMREAEGRPGVSLYHAIDDHLNTDGNDLAAGAVYEWVRSRDRASGARRGGQPR